MAKKNDEAVGLAIIGAIGAGYLWLKHDWNPIIAFIVLVLILPLLPYVLRFVFGGFRKGVKTETYSKGIFGERKKRIQYHDTGKEVNQVTSSTWTGGRKTRTFVKAGSGAEQTCRICGALVAGENGRFVCVCGQRWGRR